jgi:heme/copper-type cytochrome/quinol oxidase subunit 2
MNVLMKYSEVSLPKGPSILRSLSNFTYYDLSSYLFHNAMEDPLFYDLIFSTVTETNFIEARLADSIDLELGDFRLLEVSSKLVMPRNTNITALITSNDVLHS